MGAVPRCWWKQEKGRGWTRGGYKGNTIIVVPPLRRCSTEGFPEVPSRRPRARAMLPNAWVVKQGKMLQQGGGGGG